MNDNEIFTILKSLKIFYMSVYLNIIRLKAVTNPPDYDLILALSLYQVLIYIVMTIFPF